MTIRPHDFSRPPSLHPETRAKLVQWMTRTNAQLAEVIKGYSLEAETQLDDCSTAWPMDQLSEWSDKTVAFRVKLANVDSVSMIAVHNPLAQILIGALLGEAPQGWPEERELTPSEQSVAEFFMNRILGAIADSWTGDDTVDLKLAEREPNIRRTKAFRFSEPFINCQMTVRFSFGSGQLSWLIPHDYLTSMFGSIRRTLIETELPPRQQLETLARDMTTQLVINLGKVQLSAPQLGELRVGDLVVLNQKTTEPLKATVSGQTRFLGWPGRVGNRQAFEIATDGPRRDRSVETSAAGELAANH